MSFSRTVTTACTALSLYCIFDGAAARAQTPIGILLAAGDIAKCGTESRHKKDEAVAEIIAKEVQEADQQNIPVHVLALGDLAYDHGTTREFACYDESWGRLSKLELKNSDAKLLVLPVPGNHEYVQTDARPYYSYFEKAGNPWVFQQEKDQKKQTINNGYYALKFPDPKTGPWQLIGLNSELKDNAKAVQLSWLDQQLKATDGSSKPACVLAFWHKPLFSSGTHGHGDCYDVTGKPCEKPDAPLCRPDEEAKYCGAMKTMKPFYQTLHAQGASVVLAGHDHHFEQFKRLDTAAKPDPQRGIRSFIIGTGGGALYQGRRKYRWSDDVRDVYSHSSFGVLRIELFADRYRWRFVPIKGDPEIPLKVGDTVIDTDNCVARP
jgi:acid phosphatase type 7